MNTKNFLRQAIEVVLLVAALGGLIAVLLLARPGAPAAPTAASDAAAPLPYVPPGERGITPTIAYQKPPLCQFGGGAAPETNGPSLDDYLFSEPQVVLTSTTALGIAAWLPDSQRLLITRRLPESNIETIETFNARTGETHFYAEGDSSDQQLWLPDLRAVAYTKVVRRSDNPLVVDHYELWISYGNPQQAEQVAADVSNALSAVNGERLIYFSPSTGDMPMMWSAATKTTQAMTALDLSDLVYPKYGETEHSRWRIPGMTFQIAAQPGGRYIAFYGSNLLYLADTQTGQVCEVDLGAAPPYLRRWTFQAAWSADGRYLATADAYNSYPGDTASYGDIIVVDTLTGEKYTTDLGIPFIYQIAWDPNNHILAVLGNVSTMKGIAQNGLFLVDVGRKESKRMLPDRVLDGGSDSMMPWSPNGQAIAFKCPVLYATQPLRAESRICTIGVTTQP